MVIPFLSSPILFLGIRKFFVFNTLLSFDINIVSEVLQHFLLVENFVPKIVKTFLILDLWRH